MTLVNKFTESIIAFVKLSWDGISMIKGIKNDVVPWTICHLVLHSSTTRVIPPQKKKIKKLVFSNTTVNICQKGTGWKVNYFISSPARIYSFVDLQKPFNSEKQGERH